MVFLNVQQYQLALFLINEKAINDKNMIEYFKLNIVKYYKDIFLKNTSIEEAEPITFKKV